MKRSNFFMESHFHGTTDEWLSQMPEDIIHEAINILNLAPIADFKRSGYSPIQKQYIPNNIKCCLWEDIIQVIVRWGFPTPTQTETTPHDLLEEARKKKRQLNYALDAIQSLSYDNMFDCGTLSKEHKIGDSLRQRSEVMRANREGTRGCYVSSLIISQEREEKGKWQKYYPMDHELEKAKDALDSLVSYCDNYIAEKEKNITPIGTKKKAKDNYDHLIWAFCTLYKKYTGLPPKTSMRDDGTARGNIIQFLQLLLPETSYSLETTDSALCNKIKRMKKHEHFSKLWADQ